MKEIIQRLSTRFDCSELVEQRNDLYFISVKKTDTVSAITHLKTQEGFTHLVMIAAVDFIEDGVFQLTYLLHNHLIHKDVGIRVKIPRDDPEMESIHTLWKHAKTYQKELREMFGINFPGSTGIEENFLLEGWNNIPPMRKDFDTLAYAQDTFFPRSGRKSYDPQKYMKEKLYPDKDPE